MKKRNEDDPESLGGRGALLPADVLKMVNEVLEQMHRKDKDHQGSIVFNIYGKGSQHIDNQINIGAHPGPLQRTEKVAGDLPKELATDKAMELWKKAQEAGYVDDNYQPLISRTQAALLADTMAERLSIKEKWKMFEGLWNRRNTLPRYVMLHLTYNWQKVPKKNE
ncbi:hypothetical protein [uncultured Prevotella sp.]|uniref:hypothetical protein n=1 Tax=uncultured Prevotella sp. TaxID=159272 RepID=UPI0025FAC526|nr:hypothetical protein [uncultured Prevotella sp.]